MNSARIGLSPLLTVAIFSINITDVQPKSLVSFFSLFYMLCRAKEEVDMYVWMYGEL